MEPRQHVGFLVLGAGLQGASIALELARRGQQVTLVERDPLPMNRASLRNEGKIHLGLIYAADPTFETAALQLKGALHFQRLLRAWLGAGADTIGVSTPFTYLVAHDSLLDADALGEHYELLAETCRDLLRSDRRLDYLGFKPEWFATRASAGELARTFRGSEIAAGFLTEERAIDTDALAAAVCQAVLHHPRIAFVPNFTVKEIQRRPTGIEVSGADAQGKARRIVAGQVVNATWEQRMRLDQSVGLQPLEGWLHRLKYRVIVRLPRAARDCPSATMVLGRYGDVVIRPNGTAYVSWYPSGLQGWSHEVAPPEEWDAPCRGAAHPQTASDIGAEILRHVSAWYPAMGESAIREVDAGVVLAHGRTDVDDRGSGLHHRTSIGVSGDAEYMSVNPGKLTTAPLFACEAVDRLLGARLAESVPSDV